MFRLSPPDSFPFPFPPYSIQNDLMKQIYKNVEEGNLSILESPTGTGKTLSLICGALTWLRDHEEREKRRLEEESKAVSLSVCSDNSAIDWISVQSQNMQNKQLAIASLDQLESLQKREKRIQNLSKRRDTLKVELEVGANVVNRGKLEDMNSSNKRVEDGTDKEDLIDEDNDLLLPDLDLSDNVDCDGSGLEKDEEIYTPAKIYFCSRTHSQLAQVVGEVQRSPFGSKVRVVSLASRQNYCINPNVQKLKNLTLINERCTELCQQKSTVCAPAPAKKTRKNKKEVSRCPFIQQGPVEILSLTAMLEVLDVEQLVQKGKKEKGCPYFASRASVGDAQLVLLPYTTLLHRETREASGINLKGAIVIIDEAHNLLDTISHIHSTEVSGYQLIFAYSQLSQYEARYSSRLSSTNLLMIRQLKYVISQLIAVLGGKAGQAPSQTNEGETGTTVTTLDNFLCSCNIDNINIMKLLDYSDKTKLSHKLNGFADRYPSSGVVVPKLQQPESGLKGYLSTLKKANTTDAEVDKSCDNVEEPNIGRNPILPFLALLKKLTCDNKDGRMLCVRQTTVGRGIIKFLLLNPAAHFSDVVQQARAVIVAGGTMQPMSEFRVQLFECAGATPERITDFSCDHVVPPENIYPIIVPSGPSGLQFDFSYRSRNRPDLINELGRCLVNLSCVVPAGLVVFFPSYEYEKQLSTEWSKSGVLSSIEKKKKVFREPKTSSSVEQVLEKFAKHIKICKTSESGQNGAVLFSVVGGKMSEGINFSDDLGRCVVVVGMPYPNSTSLELKEKMTYLNVNHQPVGCKQAGQQYYEDLCMKAVNQCIGRAVRHRGDYATMVLLDHRYKQQNVKTALPHWIQTRLCLVNSFGQAIGGIKKFFNGMSAN